MLVLTRKQQEKICIGDEIVITVLRVKGKSVRVGIEAPDKVCVLRGELVCDVSADKELGSNLEHTTETTRKPVFERAGRCVKMDIGQVDTADTAQHAALPQMNVYHLQIPQEGCQQVMASLQNDRSPLEALLENRTPTV
jgi:carbon storage regulator